MAFNQPPNVPPAAQSGANNAPLPQPPAPPPSPQRMTPAEMSAMGTTAGAPVTQTSKGPQAGSGLPGSGPPPAPPGNAPAPPPVGAPNAAPRVQAHAGARSVGTHQSRSPNKRANPVHGMTE